MKKIFSLAFLAILAFALNANAQSSLIATLSHEGEIKVFYGADALVNAHNAAVHGDVITLSSGSFKSTNITKAITLRGAGMVADTTTNMEPTTLAGAFVINIPDSVSQRLIVEGIYNDERIYLDCAHAPQVSKSRFKDFEVYAKTATTVTLPSFINCRFAGTLKIEKQISAEFHNCIINDISLQEDPFLSFINCYIKYYLCRNSEYKNCVIDYPDNLYGFDIQRTSTYYNNLLISNANSASLNISNNTNKTIATTAAGSLTSDYTDYNNYELPADIKELMKGTDGTEIGIHGGNFPYDPTPNNPQITKFDVAKKSTADGKLNIVLEIKGAE